LPKGYRWRELAKREGLDQLDYYKRLLLDLGKPDTRDALVRAIFTDAQTLLRKPTNLKALTSNIDQLDWFSAREEGLGNLYEGLLEKNAEDKKSGAGQYFTPRRLIDCIIRLMKPQAGEVVQDPAAGTGGFLVAADRYIKDQTDDLYKLPEQQVFFQRHSAFLRAELVPDTHRLCLMNLLLHGIEGGVELADTLSPDGERLPKADLVLTNPPFGAKRGGGRPTRSDFSVTADTSNKQLAFVEHVVRTLKPGGRVGMVVPDNVLSEDNTGRRLRTWLMDLCNLHTILRLPTGIFYSQAVKTNVLFFQRGKTDKGNTNSVWVYDMRANAPAFGKTRPLTVQDFADFEKAYGDDPNGGAKRKDQGEDGRCRCFTREQIKARTDNLDITWLRDTEAEAEEQLTEAEDIAATIIGRLKAALEDVETLSEELEPNGIENATAAAGEMSGLPKSWRGAVIEDLAILNRKRGRDILPDEQVSFVPMSAVSAVTGEIEGAQVRPFSEVSRGYTQFQSGDVIFAKITPCMENRKIAVARELTNGVACGSTEFHVLRPSDGISADYLWRFMRQKNFRTDAEISMTGAVGQRRVPVEYLKRSKVPLPPLLEQRRIVAKIDRLSAKSKRARDQLDQMARLIDHLDQAVLAKAFRGELVPQDLNDEPAAVLLERIRAQRQTPSTLPSRKGQSKPTRGRKK
jgi:type I restriction enzyme M protein